MKSHEAEEYAVHWEQWKQAWHTWEKLQGISVIKMPATVSCAHRQWEGKEFFLLHDDLDHLWSSSWFAAGPLYKGETSEKSQETLYPVGLRVSAGHDLNTIFVILPVQRYRLSFINFCNKSENRLDMSINFPVTLHFLQCSKGVKKLKYKLSGNKFIATGYLCM